MAVQCAHACLHAHEAAGGLRLRAERVLLRLMSALERRCRCAVVDSLFTRPHRLINVVSLEADGEVAGKSVWMKGAKADI